MDKRQLRDTHAQEVAAGKRFEFGANWWRYIRSLQEPQIQAATESLLANLGAASLVGHRFLDVGCGSGIVSLAAHRAGAEVVSIDFDPLSVACAQELQRRYSAQTGAWSILRGSALDDSLLESLGGFSVVYSWGVLHHTGEMWRAVEGVARRVTPGGKLFIALYNDQGWISKYWLGVKRLYNSSFVGRSLVITVHLPYFVAARLYGNVVRALKGKPRDSRGMEFWRDVLDWLGGLPFEVASTDAVNQFLAARGFSIERTNSVGRRHGCNEFVFRREL